MLIKISPVQSDTVSSCGSDTSEVASHLIEIDLQDNLIWKWDVVSCISNIYSLSPCDFVISLDIESIKNRLLTLDDSYHLYEPSYCMEIKCNQ
jgi:hypothetical protein